MFWKLIFLFIVLPILELWLIFHLAGATSWGFTFLVVIGTGILGSAMAKTQGWKIWKQINHSLNRGEMPGDFLLDGLLILIGGILLITPGLITDSFGLLLLIPFTRILIRNHVKKRLKHSISRGAVRFGFYSNIPREPHKEDAIEVEWEEVPGDDRKTSPQSLPEDK